MSNIRPNFKELVKVALERLRLAYPDGYDRYRPDCNCRECKEYFILKEELGD